MVMGEKNIMSKTVTTYYSADGKETVSINLTRRNVDTFEDGVDWITKVAFDAGKKIGHCYFEKDYQNKGKLLITLSLVDLEDDNNEL